MLLRKHPLLALKSLFECRCKDPCFIMDKCPLEIKIQALDPLQSNFTYFPKVRILIINFLLCAGVATFCRVKSAFSSNEVALPLSAEEGFTNLFGNSQTGEDELPTFIEGLKEFSKDDLLRIDSEGRCIITDHGHFG